eukprot:TRINITY_DN25900_c0_g1_i1.p1 TRINITY_DN25900_c0_g1~~TRINITY_DN25900_c0_g1_i1.p1  ORF type:complete len:481 (+),score=92.70 TRINITY_DN25900_c0_g1_i1:94-1536(+)
MLAEIPTLIQPGDKEDAIGRLLDARHPAGALLGPDSSNRPSPPEGLLRYRSVVNQVHPDRCVDSRAARAFRRASMAFDVLCTLDSTPAVMTASAAGWDPSSESSRPPKDPRFWDIGGINDIDRCLEFRAAAMKTLWEDMTQELTSTQRLSRLRRCVSDAERACEHLDRSKGYRHSRLWPTSPLAAQKASTRQLSLIDEARTVCLRYVDLLCHLRAVHRFCQLLGAGFDHAAELDALSPPSATAKLLQEVLCKAETSTGSTGPEAAAAPDGDVPMEGSDDEIDPLDAYMATIEEEVKGLSVSGSSDLATPGEAPSTSVGIVSNSNSISHNNIHSNGNNSQGADTKSTGTHSKTNCFVNAIDQNSNHGYANGSSPPTVAAPNASQSTREPVDGTMIGIGSLAAAKGKRPTATVSAELRLANGKVVHLAGEAAAADRKAAEAVSGKILGAQGNAVPVEQVGLQNKLLGDLDSEDESELEDGGT